MKFKLILSLLLLVLAGRFEVWGEVLHMERILGKSYDQLVCAMVTSRMDNTIFSIVDIIITDQTDPLNKIKLASWSTLQPDMCTKNENDGSMKVSGGVSRYQARLNIRFNKERSLELGSFLCELTFMGHSGHIGKMFSVVKPDLFDVNKDKLIDNSDLILAVQVNELRNQFADTVSVLTNRTAEIEESLVQLIDRKELTGRSSSNTTCVADKSLQEIQNSLNKMANDTSDEMDQLIETTKLHSHQADNMINLTKLLSNTVREMSDETTYVKEEIDKLTDSTNLHRHETKQLSNTVSQMSDDTTRVKKEIDHLTNMTKQLSSRVNQISDSVDASKDRTENNEDTLTRLISHVEAMDARLTNMSTIISHVEAIDARLTNMSTITSHVEAMDARLTNMSTIISRVEAIDARLTNMSTIISKHDKIFTQMGDKMEVIDAKFTSMTTKLDKVLEDSQTEQEVKNECYKGMPWQISSLRIPVLVTENKTALCDTATDGGGWIIIQRRVSGEIDFYRGWAEYKQGFGDVTTDYWLGNEAIHQLTSVGNFQLRVDMMYQGKKYYAQYTSFSVGSESSNYMLSVDGYSGDASDRLKYHNKKPFSTYDRDNDNDASGNCAADCHGAWWYDDCYNSNLNGKWGDNSYSGMVWYGVVDPGSVSFSEMKIRLT